MRDEHNDGTIPATITEYAYRVRRLNPDGPGEEISGWTTDEQEARALTDHDADRQVGTVIERSDGLYDCGDREWSTAAECWSAIAEQEADNDR